jgi:phage gp45-like
MSGQSPYLTRFELDEDEERDDGYLYASGRGRAGHAPKHILQPQQFGLSSRPPPGSIGMQLALGGDHSTSLLIGAEHPSHRPKMGGGHTVLYDAYGQAISIVETMIRFVANEKIVLVAPMIVLESADIRLGGEDAARPASAQGTLDSAGHAEQANFATTVRMK